MLRVVSVLGSVDQKQGDKHAKDGYTHAEANDTRFGGEKTRERKGGRVSETAQMIG